MVYGCLQLLQLLPALTGCSSRAWVWALRFLAFRLLLGAGAGKACGGDPAWVNGRAMAFHYETQPLPNPLSQYAHYAPGWWHRIETWCTYVPEGLVALLFLHWQHRIRVIGFVITALFNAIIAGTGNYGHLHMLTVVIAQSLLVEPGPSCYEPGTPEAAAAAGYWLQHTCAHTALLDMPIIQGMAWAVTWTLCAGYSLLACVPLALTFRGRVKLPRALPGWRSLAAAWASSQQLHCVGYYNLFSHMTRARWELVLEGSADGGRSWHEFDFAAKPGADLDRQPPLLPPGHIPRLDWRMWFLPISVQRLMKLGLRPMPGGLSMSPGDRWYRAFMLRVLHGEPDVLALIAVPPALQGRQLTDVRSLVYSYHFTNPLHGVMGGAQQAQQPQQQQQQQPQQQVGGSKYIGWQYGKVWRRAYVCLYDALHAADAQPGSGGYRYDSEEEEGIEEEEKNWEEEEEEEEKETAALRRRQRQHLQRTINRRARTAGKAASRSAGGSAAARLPAAASPGQLADILQDLNEEVY